MDALTMAVLLAQEPRRLLVYERDSMYDRRDWRARGLRHVMCVHRWAESAPYGAMEYLSRWSLTDQTGPGTCCPLCVCFEEDSP